MSNPTSSGNPPTSEPARQAAAELRGLTFDEVAQRRAAGLLNVTGERGARPLSQIVRSNTLTVFNLVIGVMWVLMLLIAPFQDSLFGFVIVINTAIGIVQEYRASRALAKLSLLSAAQPVVRRDGTDQPIQAVDVVRDDVIMLAVGDQIAVDGPVLVSGGLQVDESLLTGEADPVVREAGDPLLSGSFVVAGWGAMRAEQVGAAAYAAGLTAAARVYRKSRSELMTGIMKFVRVMSYLIVPVGFFLFRSQREAHASFSDALSGSVAGLVTMIPEGLVLMTSIAMAVSVVRLARLRTLVQEMPAVETLARVDVVCVDKTGTLTEPGMAVRQVIPLGAPQERSEARLAAVLAGLAAAEPNANPTLAALAAAYPPRAETEVDGNVPFSSARKWSAARLTGAPGVAGWWVLGAPEFVLAGTPDCGPELLAQVDQQALGGRRVLLVAAAGDPPQAERELGPVVPLGLVVVDQTLRPDARETLHYFQQAGVALKVISGDNPTTVGAIAAQAGVPGADEPVDARDLPTDETALGELLDAHSVFGRVTPNQKRAMVRALQARGHVVAMTGDGVNDVLALKEADLGIAMGSGAPATRTVAEIVLLDNEFAVMPAVVAEGRRVLGNIERVATLFVNKSFYAMVLAILTSIAALPFPFLPRHLTVVTALTIGTPAFFLALMPNTALFRPGFVRRVIGLALPSGVVCAVAAMGCYGIVLLSFGPELAAGALTHDDAVAQARVAATITLFIAAWWTMFLAAQPMNAIRATIVSAMAVGFLLVLYVPWLSRVFALELHPDQDGTLAVGCGVAAAGVIWLIRAVSRRFAAR